MSGRLRLVSDNKSTSYRPKGNLIVRAVSAYFLRGDGVDFPSSGAVVEHESLRYVVLFDSENVVAVYRIRPDTGALRRLRRWPAGVEQEGRRQVPGTK
jgi:hypothetical protein